MKPNPYNLSQWHWIADRLDEGYKMREITEFLGMHQSNVKYNLIAIGRVLEPEAQIPLNHRKNEFNALSDDGSPPAQRYLKSVVGTDGDGNEIRFGSISAAEEFLGIPHCQISNAIKYGYRCRGFKWRKEYE